MTARPTGAAARTALPSVEPCAATARGMALLRAGVPLSLLLDLLCGPRSEELLADERPAGLRS